MWGVGGGGMCPFCPPPLYPPMAFEEAEFGMIWYTCICICRQTDRPQSSYWHGSFSVCLTDRPRRFTTYVLGNVFMPWVAQRLYTKRVKVCLIFQIRLPNTFDKQLTAYIHVQDLFAIWKLSWSQVYMRK